MSLFQIAHEFGANRHEWIGRDVLSTHQFNEDSLALLFRVADRLRSEIKAGRVLKLLEGRILACAFMEPSTRTSCSFIAAVQRLGGTSMIINEQVLLTTTDIHFSRQNYSFPF